VFTIDKDYELQEIIGNGSYGVVVSATHPKYQE